MPVTDQEICTIRYAGIENTTRFITDDMICAGRPYEDEFDACQVGDNITYEPYITHLKPLIRRTVVVSANILYIWFQ